MDEMQLLIDLHKDAERQGPGSEITTKKALDFISIDKFQFLKIVDIGCGTGAQTITLAQNLNAQITAVDLFPQFLQKLNEKAKELGLDYKIKTLQKSMEDLPFSKEEFDIIWSEGAIYNMGFAKGIKQWKKYLKKDGVLAVSEISWTTNSRPKEIELFWQNEYPEIDTVANKIKILEHQGFSVIGHFVLPEYCWIDNYYKPLEDRFSNFLSKHHYSEQAKELIELEKLEIKNYLQYKDFYSYGFYIAQKN